MHLSKSVLHSEVIEQVREIKSADILVGIPSYENALTIARVVKAASEGLKKYFPELRAVIVNSDGGSRDGTRDDAIAASTAQVPMIVTEYMGRAGKGSAFRTIFEIADRLSVKTCIVLDSDLRSITPEWIRLLGEPVHAYNYGFVAPLYTRHKFDGTITNSIVHPLMCALYGRGIRQPIGGEFALSGGLVKILTHEDIWESDVAGFGIDIWLTTTAVCEGFAVCQADMGVKVHDGKDPGADLGPMFRQVIGTMFELMDRYQIKWRIINGCRPVDIFGRGHLPKTETDPITINVEGLIGRFRQGCAKYESIMPEIIAADNYAELRTLIGAAEDGSGVPVFPDRLWARLVYDHAIAYSLTSVPDHEAVLGSMMALFLGRTAGFAVTAANMSELEVEESILMTTTAFAAEKPYLLERWRAGDTVLSH